MASLNIRSLRKACLGTVLVCILVLVPLYFLLRLLAINL